MSTPSREAIIEELKSRIANERQETIDSADDIRTPGFNQSLGALDSLEDFLNWIEENE